MYPKLASNSFFCLSILCSGIASVHHHTETKSFIFKQSISFAFCDLRIHFSSQGPCVQGPHICCLHFLVDSSASPKCNFSSCWGTQSESRNLQGLGGLFVNIPVSGQKLYKGFSDCLHSPKTCTPKWLLMPQSEFWSCCSSCHLFLASQ